MTYQCLYFHDLYIYMCVCITCYNSFASSSITRQHDTQVILYFSFVGSGRISLGSRVYTLSSEPLRDRLPYNRCRIHRICNFWGHAKSFWYSRQVLFRFLIPQCMYCCICIMYYDNCVCPVPTSHHFGRYVNCQRPAVKCATHKMCSKFAIYHGYLLYFIYLFI